MSLLPGPWVQLTRPSRPHLSSHPHPFLRSPSSLAREPHLSSLRSWPLLLELCCRQVCVQSGLLLLLRCSLDLLVLLIILPCLRLFFWVSAPVTITHFALLGCCRTVPWSVRSPSLIVLYLPLAPGSSGVVPLLLLSIAIF